MIHLWWKKIIFNNNLYSSKYLCLYSSIFHASHSRGRRGRIIDCILIRNSFSWGVFTIHWSLFLSYLTLKHFSTHLLNWWQKDKHKRPYIHVFYYWNSKDTRIISTHHDIVYIYCGLNCGYIFWVITCCSCFVK